MAVAYLVSWTEFERGWGQRPDGYSLHATMNAWKKYLATFQATLSAAVPDEYSAPGEPVAVEVSDKLYAQLLTESRRYYGRTLVVSTGPTGQRMAKERDSAEGPRFMTRLVRNELDVDAVDAYIEAWHQSDKRLTLAEFLGMTAEEYAAFEENPDSLYKALHLRLVALKAETGR
jgi:hypothetical protein